MAIRPEDAYAETNPASAAYPEGSAKNVSTPGGVDGTPLDEKWLNDVWGVLQKILDVAGITPSGVADTVLASDYWDGLEKSLNRFLVYDDSGAADAYVLTSVQGAVHDAYLDGEIVMFMADNPNTGASTIDRDSIGAVNLKDAEGNALTGGEVTTTKYTKAVYVDSASEYRLLDETFVALKQFTSAAQVITSAGALVIAHGLGVIPSIYEVRLTCLVNDNGYLAGDELVMNSHYYVGPGAAGAGLTIVPDATNINIRFVNTANVFATINKTTGAQVFLTNANWEVTFRCFA
jgi:hypothetical protein